MLHCSFVNVVLPGVSPHTVVTRHGRKTPATNAKQRRSVSLRSICQRFANDSQLHYGRVACGGVEGLLEGNGRELYLKWSETLHEAVPVGAILTNHYIDTIQV